jgi:hypothetical protein
VGAALLAAAALAAQVYAGYPQFALYSGVVALSLVFCGRGSLGRRVRVAALVGAGGVALAAPALLAGLAMAGDSTRFGPQHAAALAALDVFSLKPATWLEVVRATPLDPLLPCKLAPIAIALACIGATTRDRSVRVIAAFAVGTAVLATQPTTLFRWLHSLPPFSFFAGPIKLFYLTAFLTLVLAGVGVEAFLARAGRLRARIAPVLAVLVVAISAHFLVLTRALTAPAVFSGGPFAPLLREGPEAISGGKKAARWLALAPGPPLRQVGLNYGALWGVDALNGVGPLPAWRQIAVMESLAPDAAVPVIRQVGADAVIVQAGGTLEHELLGAGFAAQPSRAGLRTLAAPWPIAPRFQLATDATAMDANDMIALARQGRALTRTDVALESSPAGATWHGDAAGTLVVLQNAPERAVLRARVDRPTWLVARDAYRTGWRAVVDGAPAAIVPAAGFFQALLVPAGNHEIVFTYTVDGLQSGGVILLLAIGLLPALASRTFASED